MVNMELLNIAFSIGSNADQGWGERSATDRVEEAIAALCSHLPIATLIAAERLDSTIPHYMSAKCAPLPAYANAVVAIAINFPINASLLNEESKYIEWKLGRRRPAPRVAIDIDVIFDGNNLLRQHEIGRKYNRLPLVKMLLKGDLNAMGSFLRLLLGNLPVEP